MPRPGVNPLFPASKPVTDVVLSSLGRGESKGLSSVWLADQALQYRPPPQPLGDSKLGGGTGLEHFRKCAFINLLISSVCLRPYPILHWGFHNV